jgi:PRC-barrel domain
MGEPMVANVDTRRETASLIGSDKVEGTAVYGTDQQSIGSVQRVMIDKVSGMVAYAVVSFGGFLGMGEEYFPMPWRSLTYDINVGGYRTNMTESQLKGAPKFNRNTDWDWSIGLIGHATARCTTTTGRPFGTTNAAVQASPPPRTTQQPPGHVHRGRPDRVLAVP